MSSWLVRSVGQGIALFLILVGSGAGIATCALPFDNHWTFLPGLGTLFVGIVGGFVVCKAGFALMGKCGR